MILAMILMFINKKNLFLTPIFSIITFTLLRITSFLADSKGYSFLKEIIPSRVLQDFSGIERINAGFSRIDIWQYAISLIKERPLWGWGSGTFPYLIENSTTYWRGHPHNLVLELAFSFGLIITLIIVIAIILILLRSLKIIFFKEEGVQNYVNKSWLVSLLIILFAQMVDIQYFDIRISMAIWILLSGLKTLNQVF
jgi:O-antigen ligase